MRSGLIDLEQFEACLRPDTSLVNASVYIFDLLNLSTEGECYDGEQRDRSDSAC